MKKIKEDSSYFSFYFRDRNRNNVGYTAKYNGGNNLRISIYNHNETSKTGYVSGKDCKDPWKAFYENATFEEILRDIEKCRIRLFEDLYRISAAELKRKEGLEEGEISDKKILSLVRDSPYFLHINYIRDRFIDILQTAKWSLDDEKRKKAKYLLKDHLVPTHTGGSKPLPDDITLSRATHITKCLAESLSKKCREAVDCFTERKGQLLDKEDYNELIKWSIKNNEMRIRSTSLKSSPENHINDLSALIFTPDTFAENLVGKRLKTSFETIKKRKSRRKK